MSNSDINESFYVRYMDILHHRCCSPTDRLLIMYGRQDKSQDLTIFLLAPNVNFTFSRGYRVLYYTLWNER